MFLYKHYDTLSKSSKPTTPELIFIQDKVNNLNKYMKFLQSPVKTIPFYPPPQFKPLLLRSLTVDFIFISLLSFYFIFIFHFSFIFYF